MKWVAYETLSKKERKARHLAAAAFLERSRGPDEEEVVEVIASHYLQAYESAPEAEDAGEIRQKAHRSLVLAGERAASLGASGEARRYFEQAAELVDEQMGKAELLERAGDMAMMGGRLGEARSHYEDAIHLFDKAGGTHAAARVTARIGEVDTADGQLDRAIEAARQMSDAQFQPTRSRVAMSGENAGARGHAIKGR